MVHPGAYRGNKRQKEIKRLQKQDEKRLRRLQKKSGEPMEPESTPADPGLPEAQIPAVEPNPGAPQAGEPVA